ncbi:MAG: hypothetical protein HOK06_06900 [Rhodospirillaceae bacterium]|jgi:hypothetical protein|nr:hypothetical protein [Rhodospirillaceae bacterium]MBT4219383.1 hypothetical protein [Rhodospirillaceae bacterium]MBT4464295.1 hypothetical protein [Rhodospirillaceae bacterium]MBT5014075.1 hypothetical protein [Rhodospirillaceae bacterium]MBT5308704.1 hypothetical protein [Rhodospirillaceae bacterium]
MIAGDFEELVAKCVISGFPHRMMYVFVHASFMDDSDPGDDNDEMTGVVQVLFDAHQAAQPDLTFDDVRKAADAQNPNWNIVVISISKNSDASKTSDEQAEAVLVDMRDKILTGDIDGFSLLNRDGQSLEFDAEVVDGSDDDETPHSVH